MVRDPNADQTAPIAIPGVPSSAELRRQLAEEGHPVLLAFSRGKDSVAAWLAMREAGITVVPFFLYGPPGLRFIEESLADCEEFFGQHIIRLPHVSFFRQLNAFTFQPPERCAVIEAARLPEPDYVHISEMIRRWRGLPDSRWTADGIRAADSPNRRTGIKTHGAIRPGVGKVSVVWDWRIRHVRAAIAEHGAPMPVDYDWFGRSFDGIDYRFIEPLSRHAPDDYQRVLDWFPLADLELFRARLER